MKPIYISNISILGAQSIEDSKSIHQVLKPVNAQLIAIEPNYTAIINPVRLRRMSRIHKMSLYTGLKCLQEANLDTIDAVLIGTAKGSMIDTEKFIGDMIVYNEETLNPMPFIASTYNAVNGAIALSTQTTVYNQTYVNRGSSFENALLDAIIFCNEQNNDTTYVLVGAFEELTKEYFALKNKLGYWKTNLVNTNLQQGTIAGEGVVFMTITNSFSPHSLSIATVDSRLNIQSSFDSVAYINNTLNKYNNSLSTFDIIVLGWNGDIDMDERYNVVATGIAPSIPILQFKNLFGEFETVNAFSLWLLNALYNGGDMPKDVILRGSMPVIKSGMRFLIYSHYYDENHNIITGSFT